MLHEFDLDSNAENDADGLVLEVPTIEDVFGNMIYSLRILVTIDS